jgi:hypothetical protein
VSDPQVRKPSNTAVWYYTCADALALGMMEHSRKGAETMSERDYPAKEETLHRLSEPEGDHELHTALERMRVNHQHLWEVLQRVHLAHNADPSKLEEWRRAPEGSEENIWAEHYDKAMRVLQMSLQ